MHFEEIPAQVYMDRSQDGTEFHKEDLRRLNAQLDTPPGIFMTLGPTVNPTGCLYDADSGHTTIIIHIMALVWGIQSQNECVWFLTEDAAGNCLYKLALVMAFKVDELKRSKTKQQKTKQERYWHSNKKKEEVKTALQLASGIG